MIKLLGEIHKTNDGILIWDSPYEDMQLAIKHSSYKDKGIMRRAYYSYILTHDGEHIFYGNDYSPSPGADDADIIGQLLDFLSLRKGDTDDEYFKDYTPEQLLWVEEYADELQSMYEETGVYIEVESDEPYDEATWADMKRDWELDR